MNDPFVGHLTFVRVYSGVLSSGDFIYNSVRQKKERVGRLLKMHANKREEIKTIYAGEIAAVVGLKTAYTGTRSATRTTRSSSSRSRLPRRSSRSPSSRRPRRTRRSSASPCRN